MRLHVSGQLRTLSASIRAQSTLVRLLAGVRAQMHDEIGAIGKHLQRVVFLPCHLTTKTRSRICI